MEASIYISYFEWRRLSLLRWLILPFDTPCIYRAYVYHARDGITHIMRGKKRPTRSYMCMCVEELSCQPPVYTRTGTTAISLLCCQTQRNRWRTVVDRWKCDSARARRGLYTFRWVYAPAGREKRCRASVGNCRSFVTSPRGFTRFDCTANIDRIG